MGLNREVGKEEGVKNVRMMLDPTANRSSIQQVQQILNHKACTQDLKRVLEKAKELDPQNLRSGSKGKAKLDRKEVNLVYRYLGSIIQLGHFHHPCVCENMTVEEFTLAVEHQGFHIVVVRDHKTATKYPAAVAFSAEEFDMMQTYRTYIRGDMPEDDTPNDSKFFRNSCGNPISNFCTEIGRLQEKY